MLSLLKLLLITILSLTELTVSVPPPLPSTGLFNASALSQLPKSARPIAFLSGPLLNGPLLKGDGASIDPIADLVSIPRDCSRLPLWDSHHPTPEDWQLCGTDEFLKKWRTKHVEDIENFGGFAAAWGNSELEDPDYNCLLDGPANNCNFDASRSNEVLKSKGADMRHIFYITEGIVRLNSYCRGQRQSFMTASDHAALTKDSWVANFDEDPNKSAGDVKQFLIVGQTIFAILAAGASAINPFVAAGGGAVSTLFGGLNGVFDGLDGVVTDQTFKKTAQVGANLGKLAVATAKGFAEMNDALMKGENFNGAGDIVDYLKGGFWVNYEYDGNRMVDTMVHILTAHGINQVWRGRMVYIIGGGKCGDGDGIGEGPKEAVWCDKSDNTAWYLYLWHGYTGSNFAPTNDDKYGWVTRPYGFELLGTGEYANISYTDVIISSIKTQKAVPLGTDDSFRILLDRAKQAIGRGINPLEDGARG